MNKLICITGMPGAGKSIVANFFVDKGYHFVRFGQITLDEIKRRNLKPSESNERLIRERIRRKYGMAAYALLNNSKFKKLLKTGNVIADGLYSWSEYKYLKERYGDKMHVIAVYAPPKLRYERLSLRKITKQDHNLRFRPFGIKEAKERDYAEIENLEKGGPIVMSDYTILNTKDIPFLTKQLEEIYQEI